MLREENRAFGANMDASLNEVNRSEIERVNLKVEAVHEWGRGTPLPSIAKELSTVDCRSPLKEGESVCFGDVSSGRLTMVQEVVL